MVIIEQLVAPSAHSHSNDVALPLHKTNNSHVEPVAHIEEIDATGSPRQGDLASVDDANIYRSLGSEKAFSLLLGLVIHAAADGLALGVANLARNKDGNPNPISFIVFLALMLHKSGSLNHHGNFLFAKVFLNQHPLPWLSPPLCYQPTSPDRPARNMLPFLACQHR